MAEMNYPHPPDGCTPGERVLFQALRRELPQEYFVWFEPTLFGKKHSARPDFLVIGKDIGLVVIEVKDWSVDAIQSATRDIFELREGSKITSRTNPERQAENQKRALMNEIRNYQHTDPQKYQSLLRKSGKHKGKLAFSINYMVAFPNISQKEWYSSEIQLYHVINSQNVLLKNDLKGNLVNKLRGSAIFTSSLTQEQINTIRWMIYPEIRIPRQKRLFTPSPEQTGIAKIDTYIPPKAKRLTKNLQAKLVRGVVGSGKTLILLFRAKFISEQNPNWKILILTYNKLLSKYLQEVFKEIGGNPEQVQIVHFHKWCKDLLDPHGLFTSPQDSDSQKGLITRILAEEKVEGFDPQFLAEEFSWIKERLDYKAWKDYPDPLKVKRSGRGRGFGRDEKQKRQEIYKLFLRYQEHLKQNRMMDWEDVPVNVLKGIEQGIIEPHQYHAILIDEAQDFAPSWFRVAFKMVKPETSMLFIAGDGAQRIYRRDFTWKELGLGISAKNSHILTHSYRSTREILEVAIETIRDSKTLVEELRNTGDGLIEPDKVGNDIPHGPIPYLLNFSSPEEEYEGIAKEIASLLEQGYAPKDIVVLQRHKNLIPKTIEAIQRRGIPCKELNSKINIFDSAIKVGTFHRAKGLEFEIAFVCGLEKFKVNEAIDTNDEKFQSLLDQERKLLYVGMTRARKILYITYNGNGDETSWIINRLRAKIDVLESL